MSTEKIRVNLSQAPWVNCECNGMIFEPKVMFKKLSALMSPTAQEELVPVEIMICVSCGKIPKFVHEKLKEIPEELKSKSPLSFA